MNCCVVFRVLSVTSCRGSHIFFCGQERISSDQVNLRFDAITIEIIKLITASQPILQITGSTIIENNRLVKPIIPRSRHPCLFLV